MTNMHTQNNFLNLQSANMENRKLWNIVMFFVFISIFTSSPLQAEENVPYDPLPCVDCLGRSVSPAEYYYDGCNICRCYYENTAWCTENQCQWNKCHELDRDENEKDETEGDNDKHNTIDQKTEYFFTDHMWN